MNTLTIHDLRAKLRKPATRPTCTLCQEHKATDVHHLDGHHYNNEPENITPVCKRCHNDIHGISDRMTDLTLVTRQFFSIQQQRVAMNNRLAAYARLGYDATMAHEIYAGLVGLEKDAGKLVAKMLKLEPIYTAYLKRIMGVGPGIAGLLISEIGDPSRFETISALWSYSGLDVQDGAARKRRKGEVANWNAKLRMVCVGRLVPQFIKLKGRGAFGRMLYDRYKAYYLERDTGKIPLGHIENRARRKVAKVFLSCLWVAWRRIKGLPVTAPYAMERLEHTHIITPEDWAGTDWMDDVQLVIEEVKEPAPG
jgi:hypothetical protein